MVMVPKPCLALFKLLCMLGGILWQGSGCVKGEITEKDCIQIKSYSTF
jgi:hypothetical protein